MLPNYSEVIDLIKKGSTLEAQQKIVELREASLAMQEENVTLRSRIQELEKQLSLKEKLHWKNRIIGLWRARTRMVPIASIATMRKEN